MQRPQSRSLISAAATAASVPPPARWRLVTMAMLSLAALFVGVTPAASATSVIQPGSSIVADGSNCTLNWVYDEVVPDGETRAPRVFVGTAAHCITGVGQEVQLQDTTFGTVELTIGEVAFVSGNLDYAFIEVRAEHHDLVDPSLKGHPTIPTGVSTQATAQLGDFMQFSGHGVGAHLTEPTQEERIGVLNYNDGTEHDITGVVSPGDSGGPVANLTDDGKAFGIVNTVGVGVNTGALTVVTAGEGGLSLEGLLADAADAGWRVEVRTLQN